MRIYWSRKLSFTLKVTERFFFASDGTGTACQVLRSPHIRCRSDIGSLLHRVSNQLSILKVSQFLLSNSQTHPSLTILLWVKRHSQRILKQKVVTHSQRCLPCLLKVSLEISEPSDVLRELNRPLTGRTELFYVWESAWGWQGFVSHRCDSDAQCVNLFLQ